MDEKLRSDLLLLLCLVALTKIIKKPASAEALIQGLPFNSTDEKKRLFSIKSSNSNFSRTAGRAGFTSTLQSRAWRKIIIGLTAQFGIITGKRHCNVILHETDPQI